MSAFHGLAVIGFLVGVNSVVLVGCEADKPVTAVALPATVPAALQSCPGAAPTPEPPPQPRTIESLAAGYNRVVVAKEKTEVARNDCADKLHKLNGLIKKLKQPQRGAHD